MQVQFETFLFDSEDVRFSQIVDDTVLNIVTTKGVLEVNYNTHEDALDAQVELGVLLDEAKAPSVADILAEASSVVSSLFGGVFGSVKAKAASATAKAAKASDTVEQRAQDMVSELTNVLNQIVTGTQATSSTSAPRSASTTSTARAEDAQSVFGTDRTAAADRPVSDLSDTQLASAIDAKVAHLLETDARVIELVKSLKAYHSESQVNEVIEAHKQHIFAVARANDHLTVGAVIAELLRSI